ncbi:uncharacterized protein E5676_scaffold2119G00360 [Cucumis melo var. makuwa]|uniref:Reverse transcriptase domain-containing protein n=1 Tax=Cucumis melo var. makuwa TaxID=1194695 RepID=A0A5D3BYK3_CUCMM|nr:uncharacterized protein E6C27_scaffold979G00870 [Cucumis melo var. makuwa]TYK04098.1 uncharacterized protein E5676_scaffold2119G00360 [Cucumis melo var. makuwa]
MEGPTISYETSIAEISIAKSYGKIEDVLANMDKFFFPTHFIIMNYEADRKVPITLRRPFLSTGRTLIDVHRGESKMSFNDEEIKFNIVNVIKFPSDVENCSAIESFEWDYCEEEACYELFSTNEFLEEDKPNYILEEVNPVSDENKFESLDLQTKDEKKTKSSIEEPLN